LREGKKLPGDKAARVIGGLISSSINHPKTVVTVIVIITVLLGSGIGNLLFQTTFVDWLPGNDPNTEAADWILGKELKGLEAMELIFPTLDPEKAQKYGLTDINDMVGIRAQWEFYCYLQEKVPEIKLHWGIPHFINWMYAGTHTGVVPGEGGRATEEWYHLPESDDQMEFYALLIKTIITNAAPAAVPMLAGGPMGATEWPTMFMVLMYEPVPRKEYELVSSGSLEIANEIKQAILDYKEDCKAGNIEYDIFDFEKPNEYMGLTGLGSGMGHFTDLSISTAWLMIPILIAIFVCLLVAFRRLFIILVGFVPLIIGAVWIIGGMGWLRVPIGAANIAFLPLILGNGIDYFLHSVGEYCTAKSEGLDDKESLLFMGKRAGVAMSLATLTTVAGLFSMMLCESRAMTVLAFSCAFATILVTLLAFTLVPALIMLSKRVREAAVTYSPSPLMERIARGVGTHKKTVICVLIVVSIIIIPSIANLKFMVDPVGGLFPKDDYFMEGYDFAMGMIGATDPNTQLDLEIITLEAEPGYQLTTPEVIEYKYKLCNELRKSPRCLLPVVTGMFSFDWYIGEYACMRNGNIGFIATLVSSLAGGEPMTGACPMDHDTMEQYIAEMMADPYWEPFWPILMNEEHNFSMLLHIVLAHKDYADAKNIRNEIYSAIEKAEPLKPSYIRDPRVVGLRSTIYTFLNYSLFWTTVLFIVSLIMVAFLSWLFIRRWRAVAGITLSMVINTLWWLGLCAIFGLEISIAMVLPIIFITCLTSDYDIHIMWNVYKSGDPGYTYRTVGKSVFFSALTDCVAFGIFGLSSIKGFVAYPMAATALAIAGGFCVSILVIPLFIKWEEEKQEEKQ